MKRRPYALLLPGLLAWSAASAQSGTVSGRLLDAETGRPLPGATVTLVAQPDSAYRLTEATDSSGRFRFGGLRADSFRVRSSYSGHTTYEVRFRLGAGSLELGELLLPRASTELTGVVIQGRPPLATVKADTIQFNASQLNVNPDASAEDMMRKVPGVTVEGGQVKTNGETVQKVTIDGREFFGDDAVAALRNLPADIIDKIQVFDRLSDQAQLTGVDDGNTVRSINIVTKVNMRNTQFGRFYAGAGTDENGSAARYSAGGNATILRGERRISLVANLNNINQQNFSQQDLVGATASTGRGGNKGGRNAPAMTTAFGNTAQFTVPQQSGINETSAFGLNYSDKWSKDLTVTGSYFYNSSRNSTREETRTEYFTTGKSAFNFTTDTLQAISSNINHRVNLRVEWKLDSVNALIFTPALTFQINESERQTARYFNYNSNSQTLLERFTGNHNESARSGNNVNASLLFTHRFPKRGRSFSTTVSRNSNARSGDTYVITDDTRFYENRLPYDTTTQRFTDQRNGGWQLSANFVYTEPLSKTSNLQVNYNPSLARSDADQMAWGYNPQQDKYSTFLSTYSNSTRNRTDAQNAGLTYRFGERDKTFSFGANYQRTRLRSEQQYPLPQSVDGAFNNFLPNASLRWKLSPRSSVRFNYRANVNTPSVTQLQGVVNPLNAPLYSVGNPDLNPQYTHTLSGQYTLSNPAKSRLLVGNIFAQAANNYIASGSFQPLGDSMVSGTVVEALSQLRKPVNLDGYRNMRALLNYAFPVKMLKSNLNFTMGYSWNRLPGIVNSSPVMTNNSAYSLGTLLASNVSQYVDFTVAYTATKNDVKSTAKQTSDSRPQNYNYFQHVASVQLNLLSKNGWVFQTDASNQYFTGYSGNPSQNYTLWNLGIGKKFLKNRKGDLRLSVFDLLEQNQSIVRNVTETYIESQTTQVLQRYFMLTFTYNLRTFGTAATKAANRRNTGRAEGGR
jgi:hypothetical protein